MTAEPKRGSETVLVVDDDSSVRQPIVRALETYGYQVLEARSGAQALSIMDEHEGPVQLVISDVLMPEMDGAKLTAVLRDGYPRLSVLLISGNDSEVFKVIGSERPAGTHFLAKPFRPLDLLNTVRQILDDEWGPDRFGHSDNTLLIKIDETAVRAEMRIGARSRAFRIVAECEFLMSELLDVEQRNWNDAFGRVLMAARRLIALTPPGGEEMFGADLQPTTRFQEVQTDILTAVNAVLAAAASAPKDNAAARGVQTIRSLAQHLFAGPEDEKQEFRSRQSPSAAAASKDRRSTVLTVDDDPNILNLLKRSLEGWGLDVLTASDGGEGLAVVAANADRIDLVLTDIEMPKLDGVALLSALKASQDTRHIPVIVISSKDDMDSVSKCIELGAEDHISKPFAAQLLSARVKASLERKRLHDTETDGLRRIGKLISAAETVERGAYLPNALDGLKGVNDGLGQLARVFDRMVTGLKTKEERLRTRLKLLRTEVVDARQGIKAAASPLASDSPFKVGDAVADRFEIVGQLGKGGMGTVYLALDRELNEEVALKIVRGELIADDPLILERLKSEIRLARKISHPNVVRAHDIGEWEGRYFITMEKVVGVTVADLLDKRGRLTVETTLAISTQLCEALTVAHDNEIIHRDIKPANLLVDEAGTLKVMDFGIARSLTAGTGVTRDGFLVGTPQYMAPEMLMGGKPTILTDLFAVGVVLYECITGRLPYEGDSPMALFSAALDDACPRVSEIVPEVPSQLEALIHQQLRFDPTARSQSARELGQRLAELDSSKPS